jgi:hypothetical protein
MRFSALLYLKALKTLKALRSKKPVDNSIFQHDKKPKNDPKKQTLCRPNRAAVMPPQSPKGEAQPVYEPTNHHNRPIFKSG